MGMRSPRKSRISSGKQSTLLNPPPSKEGGR
jgi:hypothetical protein